jgi:hypothetical protein
MEVQFPITTNYEYNSEQIIRETKTYANSIDNEYSNTWVTEFFYDSIGNLYKEITKEISNPNVYNYQFFKPNSTEFRDSIIDLNNLIETKVFYYKDDTIRNIQYFLNNSLTGNEIQKLGPNKKIISSQVFNLNGNLIKEEYFESLLSGKTGI